MDVNGTVLVSDGAAPTENGGHVSLADRSGFNAERIDTNTMQFHDAIPSDASIWAELDSMITIPDGFSPTNLLLDSPVFLPNFQISPTSGAFSFPLENPIHNNVLENPVHNNVLENPIHNVLNSFNGEEGVPPSSNYCFIDLDPDPLPVLPNSEYQVSSAFNHYHGADGHNQGLLQAEHSIFPGQFVEQAPASAFNRSQGADVNNPGLLQAEHSIFPGHFEEQAPAFNHSQGADGNNQGLLPAEDGMFTWQFEEEYAPGFDPIPAEILNNMTNVNDNNGDMQFDFSDAATDQNNLQIEPIEPAIDQNALLQSEPVEPAIDQNALYNEPIEQRDDIGSQDILRSGPVMGKIRSTRDGFSWRKYGQKHVRGSAYPRSYYKCTRPECQVKKKVERSRDGQITQIIYKGFHNHSKPQSSLGSAFPQPEMVERNVENEVGSGSVLPNTRKRSDGVRLGSDLNAQGPSRTSPVSDRMLKDKGKSVMLLEPEGTPGFSPAHAGNYVAPPGHITLEEDEENDEPGSKRRKVDETNMYTRANREDRIIVKIESEEDILNDGYRWRKYGQKVIKGNPNPRSYYKCTTKTCPVRKHVERAADDVKFIMTSYEGKHNHAVPPGKNGAGTNLAPPVPTILPTVIFPIETEEDEEPEEESEIPDQNLELGLKYLGQTFLPQPNNAGPSMNPPPMPSAAFRFNSSYPAAQQPLSECDFSRIPGSSNFPVPGRNFSGNENRAGSSQPRPATSQRDNIIYDGFIPLLGNVNSRANGNPSS